ncbi:MAG TPA: hypothetical protein VJ184_04440 [Chryseolinea sp.]|nr:hypothetical protein [Chryseolinea sp.]
MIGKHNYIIAFYLALAIALLGKLLLPGYIPLHVSNFTPQYVPENWHELLNVFNFSHYLLTLILPAWLSQKILLTGLIVLTGLSMHYTVPSKKTSIRLLAGFFFIVNPFFHTRLMIGHLHIVAGYALLPLAFYCLRKINLRTKKSWLNLILISLLLSNLSIHMAYIFICFAGLMSLILLLKKQWKKGILSIACVLIGSLLNIQLYVNQTYSATSSFTLEDYQGFATAADPVYGILLNILGLYGYHIEALLQSDGLLFTKQLLFFWPIFTVIFLAVSLIGLISFRKKARNFCLAALLFFFISVIISIGVSSGWTEPVYEFLWKFAPFFKGFREPQKWLAFLAYFMAFFATLGVAHIMERLAEKRQKQIVLFFSFILITLYSLTFFGGYFGRISTFWYPKSWYEVKALLRKNNLCPGTEICPEKKALFLPWHEYLNFDFTSYLYISNPARQFFHPITVIQGDNIELKTIYSRSTRPVSQDTEDFLAKPTEEKLQNLLLNDKIHWIIFYNDLSDGEKYNYNFIKKMEGLKEIYKSEKMSLYQIQISNKQH